MKYSWLSVVGLAATLICLETGCTSTPRELTFKTVDAVSGRPLQGVNLEWAQVRYHFFLNMDMKTLKLPPTDGLGISLVKGAKENHSFRFDRYGYSTACAIVLPNETIGVTSPCPTNEGARAAITYRAKANGVVTIKMYSDQSTP